MTENYGLTTTGSYTPDNLLAGAHPPVEIPVTIASGAGVLARGTVMGRVNATGKYVAYNDGASDGSEIAIAILARDIDATTSDVLANVYVHGEFAKSELTGLKGDGTTVTELQKSSIFIKEVN